MLGFFKNVTKKVAQAAADVASSALEQAKAVVKKARDAANKVVDGAIDIARSAVDIVLKAFAAVKDAFTKGVAIALVVACTVTAVIVNQSKKAVNEGLNSFATGAAFVLSRPTTELLIRAVHDLSPDIFDKSQMAFDGAITNAAACGFQPSGAGVMPQGCSRSSSELPVATYINGINTSHAGHCATLQNLANRTCQQVVGIYNGTGGIFADVVECVDNIQRKVSDAQVALSRDIMKHIGGADPKEMVLYAHSQGGLIAQAAILDAKKQMISRFKRLNAGRYPSVEALNKAAESDTANRLSKLAVTMAGTATNGWPEGPKYKSFVNSADPVPKIIHSAQLNNLKKTMSDSAKIIPTVFTKHHFMALPDSHSIDDLYLPFFAPDRPIGCCKRAAS